ncbi:RNA (C5-cytosine) methyltransferase, subfamily [Heracleum sosnowskyi]|uniref:RNA (C5-cytosine) methyltransferase, subfamily n=1 Tax=Heracleum sosnowskyi TaxID=360622 RepID=A0AAD8M513_9APIA|nr:RNA (C5-cytosine) methyltransferase, subfamily [Heracleum sosnowskyi]
MEVKQGSSMELPEAFIDFLNKNGLDPSIYTATDSTPRYIRLKPGCEVYLEDIEAEIKCKLQKVEWLPNFYSLPPHVQIANSKAYREGKLYGIDAASGAAVTALDITPGDHILDLCAAPGAKLCMISDLLGSSGTVTGVDVARHRLAACRTMLQKYALGDRCRLFVADGTTFSLLPVRAQSNSNIFSDKESASEEKLDTYKEWTSRRPWKERKRANKAQKNGNSQLVLQSQDPELIFYGLHSGVVGLGKSKLYDIANGSGLSHYGYDKVLVDAECTHDGSIKHIQKFENWGWTTLQRRVLNAERIDNLNVLQLLLLTNGFKLLKVGGYLVYSTCSLTVAQNEDVVEQFLLQNSSAELLDIEAARDWPCKSGQIQKTLRFDPLTSQTSGLFVAKFTKLCT